MRAMSRWKEILYFSRAPIGQYVVLIGTMMYLAFFNILFSMFVQTGINMVTGGFVDSRFIGYTLLFCAASGGYAVAGYLFGVFQEKVVQSIAQTNRKRGMERVLKAPYSTFERYEKGDLLTRLFDDCDQISQMVVVNMLPAIQIALSIVFGLGYVLYYNLQMGLFTLLWVPFFYFVNQRCARQVHTSFTRMQEAESSIKSFAENLYDNNAVTRLFALFQPLSQKHQRLFAKKYENAVRNAKAMGRMVSLTEAGVRLLEIFNLLIGVFYVAQGSLAIGTLIGIWNVTIGTIAYSVADLPNMLGGLSMQSASLERVQEIMDWPQEQGGQTVSLKRPDTLVLDHVSFSYSNAQPLFQNLDATLDAKAINYIVGPSGSGKSTLMKLVLSLYAPDTGTIRLANLEGPTLRQAVAYVPQGRSLLHTTIRDNLCLGRSLDEKELDSLCARVNMDTVIQSLPKKYDTIVGVDHDLSEGQAPRLAIARAMAANARLVVMDEPFSALDPDNIARLAHILQADTYPGTVSLLILGVFQFSLALVYGFLNSVVFTLIILAASSIACFLPALFLKHIEKTQENKQASDAGVRDYASSVLDEVPMIKSFRAENHVAEGFDERVETYRRHAIANRKKEEMMNSVSVGIGYCVNAMWMIAGIYLIARHVITIGVFVGFISLSMELSWPFNELSRLLAGLSRASVSYTRLYSNEKAESGTKRNPEDLPADTLIQASHVFYTYDGKKDVIQDRSLTLHEGEKLLFAGPSGGGKSTFLKILSGLYTPQKGAVRRKEGLRVAYVPQTPSLFLGSIRENIRMGNPDASEQDMVEAAQKANIHDFIVRLPDGYNTHLDGLGKQNVSEGQLQRIAIARALLKKADVYLFDEITSALDEESEAAILATIRSIDAAVVMISHKPRVIDAFDQTIEFE